MLFSNPILVEWAQSEGYPNPLSPGTRATTLTGKENFEVIKDATLLCWLLCCHRNGALSIRQRNPLMSSPQLSNSKVALVITTTT